MGKKPKVKKVRSPPKAPIDPESKIKAKGDFFCLTCNRCGYIWYSKNDVKTCSNTECNSPYWNRQRTL